jgi:hypothetical protein
MGKRRRWQPPTPPDPGHCRGGFFQEEDDDAKDSEFQRQ